MSTAPRRETRWSWLGRVGYAEAVDLQHAVRDTIRRGEGPERLLLLEHAPVFTLGRNAEAGDVRAGADWLRAHQVEVHESDRGGQVTFHGPGQLVGYPIVDLSPDRRDVRRYVQDLEEVLVRTLADHGVAARGRPSPHVGIWVGDAKVASIGIHLSRWITTHGFALNVTTDLALFGGIVPCGMPEVRMTSIAALTGARPGLPEVAARLAGHFAAVFDRDSYPPRPRSSRRARPSPRPHCRRRLRDHRADPAGAARRGRRRLHRRRHRRGHCRAARAARTGARRPRAAVAGRRRQVGGHCSAALLPRRVQLPPAATSKQCASPSKGHSLVVGERSSLPIATSERGK